MTDWKPNTEWIRRFDEGPFSGPLVDHPQEPSWDEVLNDGSTDELLRVIDQILEGGDDIRDAVELMVQFFDLMRKGAPVPTQWTNPWRGNRNL